MRDVWILTAAQALAACGTIMLVTFGGIVGAELAPTRVLATLPISLSVVGVALMSLPASLLMQRVGRKPAFVGSALVAMLAALLCAASVAAQSFAGLCVAGALLGSNMAFVQQYRFAAAEFVEPSHAGRAVSTVMLGTLVAALLAPELGHRARLLGGWPEFTGSFVALAGVMAAAALVLGAMGRPQLRVATAGGPKRPRAEIARQPAFVAAVAAGVTAYGVMSFVMTATPISMHVMDGLSVDATKTVISGHLLGMYVPSLASGWLIERLGITRLMLAGLACLATTAGIGVFVGHEAGHYLIGLVLLGVGWNFLFVGGTTLLTTSYAPSERFRAQGMNDFVVFGAQAMASLLAGPVITRFGWGLLNSATVPPIALMGVVVLWLAAARRAIVRATAAAS
ncbi:MAG: MFS transporter [Vicinamibacterales bacterium]